MSARQFVVRLANGETLHPDIVSVKESGWLYCCWTDNDADGGRQRMLAPGTVDYYDSLPADAEMLPADGAEVLEA